MEEGFLDPNQALNQIDLAPNMIAVDFGSGSGGWAIPLARRLKEGRVFAIDVLKEPLSALEGKLKTERIFNIQTVCSDIEVSLGSKLGDGSVDLVLMTNLLFQIEKKKEVLNEAKRILKKGGRILVVDWLPSASVGPEEGRVLPEEAKKLAKEAGLKNIKEFEAGNYHYGILFKK